MTAYTPPVQDMVFLLNDVLGFDHPELDAETLEAVLEEAARLAADVLTPLNAVGDEHGCTLKDGAVITPPGFKDAYAQYRDGGWNAVPFDTEYGGQGLPWAAAFPVQEMWQGANMAFGLCPLLNQGAVEAISIHGSEAQKAQYLPRLISGEWTGTMNLTEPQAGSDLGLLKAKAEPKDDGSYAVTGQKIYITYGEHDFAENIIHLVLARLPDAPDDVKGISLFVVPKFLDDGARNTLECIGIEHKLGIHASPTCTMQFDGATGYLLGAPHEGLKAMFTMMNNARLSVGLQGVAIAERATQAARAYAADRVQGKSFANGERVSIDHHADVKRMLDTMQAMTMAGRALTYQAAVAIDNGDRVLVDLLTPVVKSWCTDMACDVASMGIQVHGGMGYIEETGAAQYLRDARILPIYEGTNGIQAADLAFRKVLRDEGQAVMAYIEALPDDAALAPYGEDLKTATQALFKLGQAGALDAVARYSDGYLRAFALVAGAGLLLKAAALEGAPESVSASAAAFKAFVLPHARAYLGGLL